VTGVGTDSAIPETDVARIGLISDTHGILRPEVFGLFEGVDRILFAGDAGRLEPLEDLAAIAPVDAVWGNVDGPDVREVTRESLELEMEGVRFAVTHGHRVDPRYELLLEQFPAADVIVHGHTHQPKIQRVGPRWIVNPGAASSGRGGSSPSLAIATVTGGRIRLVHFELPGGRSFQPG
jgi:putative phosphoesterase